MRPRPRLTSTIALLSALAVAGCASSTTTSSTPQKLAFHSSAVTNNTMPALYTCDGRNTWPPLEWGKVPPGTGSLALFIVGIIPNPVTHTFKASVEWAVAGLLPTLHKLDPGHLPSYAYVGINSNGKRNYSICPKKGVAEQYQFELYGVPSAYGVASSHFSGVELISVLASPTNSSHASAYGAFIAKYTRK